MYYVEVPALRSRLPILSPTTEASVNPFLLEIDVDADGKVIVRGKRDHAWNANGGTQVGWTADPTRFSDWTVDFPPDWTPFVNNDAHFDKQGKQHGRLKNHKGGPSTYSYDVTCTDKENNLYKSDPEIVVWPD